MVAEALKLFHKESNRLPAGWKYRMKVLDKGFDDPCASARYLGVKAVSGPELSLPSRVSSDQAKSTTIVLILCSTPHTSLFNYKPSSGFRVYCRAKLRTRLINRLVS